MQKQSLEECKRQIHLDFHTSPFIPDVASEFDAGELARTFRKAHVNSVTIFAKCHHGMCYYPTRTGVQHPALAGRDLLGEQIEALHREGIRCPIYTTVVWEEDVAQKHPEWRQLTKEGAFAGWTTSANQKDVQPGMWKFNNFLHPDYQDYIEAHVRELCANYEIDGLFFDILFFVPNACWSESSVRFREKHGFLNDDAGTFDRFQGAAQSVFVKKFTRLVRGLKPQAGIFYNAQNESNIDAGVGPRARAGEVTHFEIESLPSGFWGYYHFPRMARQQSHWGKFWFGMTGRFQKMWGDFGGIKPQAALEFECFRSQALGGGNSVGDQLPPRGVPDPAAYALIGAVYAQCAEAEPFYEGSQALPQIGIFSAGYPGFDGNTAGKSEEGAVQMCEETHYDAAVLDSLDKLDAFDLLILPDTTVVTPGLKNKLQTFYKNGGSFLISYKGGFDADGNWALDFLPLSFHGEVEKYPT
ncbi:MAG: alpha-amylase family protein, partial [Chthoniobacteraceae bacterium]